MKGKVQMSENIDVEDLYLDMEELYLVDPEEAFKAILSNCEQILSNSKKEGVL